MPDAWSWLLVSALLFVVSVVLGRLYLKRAFAPVPRLALVTLIAALFTGSGFAWLIPFLTWSRKRRRRNRAIAVIEHFVELVPIPAFVPRLLTAVLSMCVASLVVLLAIRPADASGSKDDEQRRDS